MRLGLAFLWLWLTAWGAWAAADLAPLPSLTARVTDQTGTLNPAQITQLESALTELEHAKGAQLAILLTPSTQPESIEAFGIRLAEAWKVGRKGVDDGVLLIVAKNDRAVRIEVGYGLEGAIPDAAAKRIIEERIVPRFRAGEYYGGLLDAVQTLTRLIDGEALPSPADASAAAQDDWQAIALFLLAAAARLLRSLFGLLGALLAGGVAGALAWYFFGSWLAGLVAAVLIVGLAFAKGSGRGGGWSSGGGYSGGGYSGGGGGFGGGGASGRW